ncbi:F-box/LRR-repeat protein 25-like protein [Tanacetum coccineum]
MQIAPKRFKLEKEEEDRISVLPECLLLEIISRLPTTKEAIRTSTLSKRWENLWTLVPNLVFRYDDDVVIDDEDYIYYDYIKDYVSFVDKTLTQCRQLKLNQFKLDTKYDSEYKTQVKKWIHYAIKCNVEELDLSLWGCVFNPISVISWDKLISLSISNGKLNEDLIRNILSGSPVLETLNLYNCYGYRLLDITSKSVKNLVFWGYRVPKNESDHYAKGKWHKKEAVLGSDGGEEAVLGSDGGELYLQKIVLLGMSSLVKAHLNYTISGFYGRTQKEAVMLKRLILNLGHVKELQIDYFCFKVLAGLEAIGFVCPSNMVIPPIYYQMKRCRLI